METASETTGAIPLPRDPERAVGYRLVLPAGDRPRRWVMVVHGYTSHGDWGFFPPLSQRLAARGIASVRVSHSGSGLGVDRTTLARPDWFRDNTYLDELTELALVREACAANADLDAARCAIVGHSRGGAMGLVHAAEDGGYRAVVGWAAMDSILRFSPDRLALWRAQGHLTVRHFGSGAEADLDVSVLEAAEAHRARLDPVSAAKRLRCPALWIVGERDRSVSPAEGRRQAAAVPDGRGKYQVIAGADHTFGAREPLLHVPATLEALWTATVDFLAAELD